ncbi:hypothetical protein LXA43DRAFT_876934 [Ganoderma leucocontextum]|nr:hypothetical protein LXA43DRAFT_876934 [Ganoderma leucocontextum]
MRQTELSEEDINFREALSNMRYASCTKADIALISSRIHSHSALQAQFRLPHYRDVSIITALNAHRDAINDVQCQCFARDNGQALHDFYSVDAWGTTKDPSSIRDAQRQYDFVVDPIRQSNTISPHLQDALWRVPPALCGNIAGVLHLSLNMPVLLKANEATELCATNGAEAVVVGWDSHHLPDGKEILDTLFVQLHNPPRPMHLPGLPENIIPLARAKNSVRCLLPIGDLQVTVQREQVMVLPNFAMTDFASQGRTRPYNVAHLKHCQNHQSLYTCLSRGTCLAQTVVVGTFPTTKLQRGLSPNLRREFRELELLDHLTILRTTGQLPSSVMGTCRGSLLKSFQNWKGRHFIPQGVHSALDWSHDHNEPFTLSSPSTATLIRANAFADINVAQPTDTASYDVHQLSPTLSSVPANSSPALSPNSFSSLQPHSSNSSFIATGLLWDSSNYSCAYDTFLTVIWNTYTQQGESWLTNMIARSAILAPVVNVFRSASTCMDYLETARNILRHIMSSINPTIFPRFGPSPTAIGDVIELCLTHPQPFANAICTSCGFFSPATVPSSYCSSWRLEIDTLLATFPAHPSISSQQYIDTVQTIGFVNHCPHCNNISHFRLECHMIPPLICLELPATPTIQPYLTISISLASTERVCRLVGIIYAGGNHFTARYVDDSHHVWYYNGAELGRQCILEGRFPSISSLSSSRGRTASHLLYASIDANMTVL